MTEQLSATDRLEAFTSSLIAMVPTKQELREMTWKEKLNLTLYVQQLQQTYKAIKETGDTEFMISELERLNIYFSPRTTREPASTKWIEARHKEIKVQLKEMKDIYNAL